MRQLTRITAPSIMDPMKPSSLLATLCIFGITGCHHPLTPDKPQLTPQVRLIDTTFYSAILARDMHLRLIVPAAYASNQKLPVVYLLHGAGADYRDWSNNSDIAAFAAQNIILVMPDEAGAYYINEASGKNRKVFGPAGSAANRANDPFVLLRQLSQEQAPNFFVTCGEKDPLFKTNERFSQALNGRGLRSEFRALQGGNNWSTWGAELPLLEAALLANFHPTGIPIQ